MTARPLAATRRRFGLCLVNEDDSPVRSVLGPDVPRDGARVAGPGGEDVELVAAAVPDRVASESVHARARARDRQ
jgi:hypothetical protein